MLEKQIKKIRRHNRVRAKIKGTIEIPRLCVSRSSKHLSVQLIDDVAGKTILSLNDSKIKVSSTEKGKSEGNKVLMARAIGKEIAEKAVAVKIKKIVFDRGGYKYHGRVKAVAEGAREGGLEF